MLGVEKDLSGASKVTYLNGNQAVCDLCLLKNSGIKREETDLEKLWRPKLI